MVWKLGMRLEERRRPAFSEVERQEGCRGSCPKRMRPLPGLLQGGLAVPEVSQRIGWLQNTDLSLVAFFLT